MSLLSEIVKKKNKTEKKNKYIYLGWDAKNVMFSYIKCDADTSIT